MASVILSLTLGDESWRDRTNDVDHIFPRSRLNKKSILSDGASEDDALLWSDNSWKNCLANLQLLTSSENKSKSNTAFDDWMKDRDNSFLDTHAIPENQYLWKLNRFGEFVEAREKLLVKRLVDLWGTSN